MPLEHSRRTGAGRRQQRAEMMAETMGYSRTFYEDRAATRVPAARLLLRDLFELVQPESVIDVGCGDGSFLSVLPEFGILDFAGVEGPWIGDDQLRIPPERVLRHDLDEPLAYGRRYDLATSIEVAEHLLPERAEGFIDDLTQLADVIVFSAAVPGQGGVNHINERWQSYWAGLFQARGYRVIDRVRPTFWTSPEVPFPWRQNMLIYAKDETLKRWPQLGDAERKTRGHILDLVHPRLFWKRTRPSGLRSVLTKQVPRAFWFELRRLAGHRPDRRSSRPP